VLCTHSNHQSSVTFRQFYVILPLGGLFWCSVSHTV